MNPGHLRGSSWRTRSTPFSCWTSSRLRPIAVTSTRAGLSVDEARYNAALDGVELDLTPMEFRLLRTLASSPGQVFSRAQLLDHLYKDNRVVTDRAVDSHIKNLRRKLQNVRSDSELIESVYGVGYRIDLSGRPGA